MAESGAIVGGMQWKHRTYRDRMITIPLILHGKTLFDGRETRTPICSLAKTEDNDWCYRQPDVERHASVGVMPCGIAVEEPVDELPGKPVTARRAELCSPTDSFRLRARY